MPIRGMVKRMRMSTRRRVRPGVLVAQSPFASVTWWWSDRHAQSSTANSDLALLVLVLPSLDLVPTATKATIPCHWDTSLSMKRGHFSTCKLAPMTYAHSQLRQAFQQGDGHHRPRRAHTRWVMLEESALTVQITCASSLPSSTLSFVSAIRFSSAHTSLHWLSIPRPDRAQSAAAVT